MKHTPDLLTLCIEDLIVRATRRYVLRRNELRALPDHSRLSHLRLIAEHRRNIERLVMLRSALVSAKPTLEEKVRTSGLH